MKRAVLLFLWLILPSLLMASTLPHPKVFVANSGQWPSAVLYGAQSTGMSLYITRTGMIIDQRGATTDGATARHRVALHLSGATGASTVQSSTEANAPRVSIAKGSISASTALSVASAVTVRNVCPGIHLEFLWDGDAVRYNVLADKGVAVPTPLFTVEGASSIAALPDGFSLGTSLGHVSMSGLVAFAETPAATRTTRTSAGRNSIAVGVDRRNTEALTIDPIVRVRTISGGAAEEITSMIYDKSGNIVVGGFTSSVDLEIAAPGAYTTRGAGTDGFVACYTPDMSRLLAWTYIAGNGDDAVRGVAVNSAGDIWVTGETMSSDLPVSTRTGGRYSGSEDGYVLRFSANLANVLAGKYIAGNREDRPLSIACNNEGDAIVCGQTKSNTGLALSTGHNITYNGGWDAFALRIEKSGSDLEFFTYFGTPGDDAFTSVTCDRQSGMIFAGWTTANGLETFPQKTRTWVPDPNDYYYGGRWVESGQNAYDVDFNGGQTDVIIVKFAANGTLSYSTYYGGSGEDIPHKVIADSEDRAIICGSTRSTDLPVAEGTSNVNAGGSDAFVFRLSADGLRLSTGAYFGGSGDDHGRSVLLDATGNLVIVGTTNSTDINNVGPGSSDLALGGTDGFIAVLAPGGPSFATLFGWSGNDAPVAMLRDPRGDLFIGGNTTSPIDGNAIRGSSDAFIAKWAFGTLTLRNPQAGVSVCTGTTVQVSWASDGIATTSTYDVEYSVDEGASWTSAAKGLNTRSYNLAVPAERPESGTMRIRVVSTNGHAASTNGNLIVNTKPTFRSQPASIAVCPGGSFELDPDVDAGVATYQWAKNGSAIEGATQRVFSITTARLDDAGVYTLTATTPCGITTSEEATVSVSANPQISEQPQDVNATLGQNIVLRVVATGANLTYQWTFDGAPVANATTNELVIQGATSSDAGNYACVVTSSCGQTTSRTARVVVGTTSVHESDNNTVSIVPQPASNSITVSHSQSLSADARIIVHSITGVDVSAMVHISRTSQQVFTVDVSALTPGTYTIAVVEGTNARRNIIAIVR